MKTIIILNLIASLLTSNVNDSHTIDNYNVIDNNGVIIEMVGEVNINM